MDTQRKSATGNELFNLIDADSIAEKTEDKFHSDNIKRSRSSMKIAHRMPIAAVIVVTAAIIVSAPFTVSFFSLVFSPILIMSYDFKNAFINITPLVIEGVIILLSAVREYGNGSRMQTALLVLLLTFSTLVNVLGAITALNTSDITGLMYWWYAGTAVLAGILVSSVGYIVGGIVIKMATGEITMEIDSSKDWQGAVKYNALKRAFENAASEYTTVSRANKYALIMAKRYSEVLDVVEDTVDAIGNGQSGGQMIGSLARLNSQASIPEMGFSPMARGNVGNVLSNDYQTDNSSKPVTTDKIRKMSKDNVIKWIENNPDAWQQWRIYKSMVANTKHIASQISEDGDTAGAKSVERAFKALEIEL